MHFFIFFIAFLCGNQQQQQYFQKQQQGSIKTKRKKKQIPRKATKSSKKKNRMHKYKIKRKTQEKFVVNKQTKRWLSLHIQNYNSQLHIAELVIVTSKMSVLLCNHATTLRLTRCPSMYLSVPTSVYMPQSDTQLSFILLVNVKFICQPFRR